MRAFSHVASASTTLVGISWTPVENLEPHVGACGTRARHERLAACERHHRIGAAVGLRRWEDARDAHSRSADDRARDLRAARSRRGDVDPRAPSRSGEAIAPCEKPPAITRSVAKCRHGTKPFGDEPADRGWQARAGYLIVRVGYRAGRTTRGNAHVAVPWQRRIPAPRNAIAPGTRSASLVGQRHEIIGR